MSESIPYLSVGFNVGVDFTWMPIMLPNDILIGKPFKIVHSDPQSREFAISKIGEAQEMYSLESRCFFESTGICRILLLCFLHDKGFDCVVINPIIIKSSTNMNVGGLRNDELNSKKAAEVGLDTSLKASIAPDNAITDLRNFVRDHYYFKDLQSATVSKLHVELKVSFPAYPSVFSKVTTQTSLKLLEAYPFTADMLTAPKDKLVETIRSTARFEETHVPARYDAICTVAKDAVVSGRALPSSTLRTEPYIRICREYQARLDSILKELHQTVDKLEGTPDYDRISFIQALHGAGFLSAIVLIAEMGAFDLFSSPKKPYAYFGLDPDVSDSGKFRGDRVHISKRGSGLARRILHMVTINNLRVDKATETPMDSVTYDHYTRKCASKKKSVAVRAVMHKICSITFAMLRGNKPFELIAPEEHRGRYTAEHPGSVSPTV